ncbi:MAG: hypothetical protein HY791_15655 [Deltaproteobacteria bacterium]|nr:hypothetical protein [Deltaproteobacteria bacterium]
MTVVVAQNARGELLEPRRLDVSGEVELTMGEGEAVTLYELAPEDFVATDGAPFDLQTVSFSIASKDGCRRCLAPTETAPQVLLAGAVCELASFVPSTTFELRDGELTPRDASPQRVFLSAPGECACELPKPGVAPSAFRICGASNQVDTWTVSAFALPDSSIIGLGPSRLEWIDPVGPRVTVQSELLPAGFAGVLGFVGAKKFLLRDGSLSDKGLLVRRDADRVSIERTSLGLIGEMYWVQTVNDGPWTYVAGTDGRNARLARCRPTETWECELIATEGDCLAFPQGARSVAGLAGNENGELFAVSAKGGLIVRSADGTWRCSGSIAPSGLIVEDALGAQALGRRIFATLRVPSATQPYLTVTATISENGVPGPSVILGQYSYPVFFGPLRSLGVVVAASQDATEAMLYDTNGVLVARKGLLPGAPDPLVPEASSLRVVGIGEGHGRVLATTLDHGIYSRRSDGTFERILGGPVIAAQARAFAKFEGGVRLFGGGQQILEIRDSGGQGCDAFRVESRSIDGYSPPSNDQPELALHRSRAPDDAVVLSRRGGHTILTTIDLGTEQSVERALPELDGLSLVRVIEVADRLVVVTSSRAFEIAQATVEPIEVTRPLGPLFGRREPSAPMRGVRAADSVDGIGWLSGDDFIGRLSTSRLGEPLRFETLALEPGLTEQLEHTSRKRPLRLEAMRVRCPDSATFIGREEFLIPLSDRADETKTTLLALDVGRERGAYFDGELSLSRSPSFSGNTHSTARPGLLFGDETGPSVVLYTPAEVNRAGTERVGLGWPTPIAGIASGELAFVGRDFGIVWGIVPVP